VGVVTVRGDGARSFTSTAGPASRSMSRAHRACVLCGNSPVIVDVQRQAIDGHATRTQQGDILLCAYASHGDTKHILLFPCIPRSALSGEGRLRSSRAFPDAVFMLSVLDIG